MEMKEKDLARPLARLLLACFAWMTMATAQQLPLMPMPATVRMAEGRFLVNRSFQIVLNGPADARAPRSIDRFVRRLSRRTGIPLGGAPREIQPNFVATYANPGQKTQALGEDESYRLEITPTQVQLNAPNPLGLLRGMQTFLQLVEIGPEGFGVPAMMVDDRPRFPWRGLLLDVSRHFMPLEAIKRNLDAMEAVKLNVLHLHLADDQGFRVESKKFPLFQRMSSDGLYYTQAEIKDLVEYARDRGIRIVPEFDMPGHTTSWFAAYPGLASAPGPYQVERRWGVSNPAMDPTNDRTYRFLNDFMGEMSRLFPDRYFHIGGDEVNGRQWDRNAKIQEFKRRHGLKNNRDLQAYFNKKLESIVKKHGKIMEGWDEVLHPDLPKDVVVQSWRGSQSLADAARQGYRGLLSAGYYLDLMRPAGQHYAVDPLSAPSDSLNAEEKQMVLGGEACMWAEFVTSENLDGRLWPRTAAIAERLWSPAEVRDANAMYARLEKTDHYLEWLGLTHNSNRLLMLQRLAGGHDLRPLQMLAGAVEPVKEYSREEGRRYDSTVPLNRLIDAVPPESARARDFAAMVDQLLKGSPTPELEQAVRSRLLAWRDNHRQLAPMLENNALLAEIVPVSETLESVSATGLQALDYLGAGGSAPADWRSQGLVMLEQAEKPQAELLNMVAAPVKRLVEATTPR